MMDKTLRVISLRFLCVKLMCSPDIPQEVWEHPQRRGVFTGTPPKANLSQLAYVTAALEDIYQGPVSCNKQTWHAY